MYNVILWKVNGDEDIHAFKDKPSFQDMYKLIECDTIEIQKGYDKEISSRSFDMYCDEESKLKQSLPNARATEAWYKWQKNTGHQCLPGDYISGNVCIIKKVQIKNWFENSLNKKDFFNKKSTTWKSLELGDTNINDQELIELSFKNLRILKRPLIEFNNKTIYSGFKEDEILTIMKKL